jgi:hypothetical protein
MARGLNPELLGAFARITALPVMSKLNGHHAAEPIELEEVEELTEILKQDDDGCRFLDTSGTGLLKDAIGVLLTRLVYPPWSEDQVKTLLLHSGAPCESHFITAEQFHSALLCPPVVEMIAAKRENALKPHITRRWMCSRISRRVERDDAFATLPLTLLHLVVLMSLLVSHLRIWERQQLERSLEAWMNPSDLLQKDVGDVDSFWQWLEDVGSGQIYGQPEGTSSGGPLAFRMASVNTVVGDVRMSQKHVDSDEDKSDMWLLHTDSAQEHLSQHPGRLSSKCQNHFLALL